MREAVSRDETAPRYFARSFAHLQTIATLLRDLKGCAALAHEIIQNADDAPKTTVIRFNISAEGPWTSTRFRKSSQKTAMPRCGTTRDENRRAAVGASSQLFGAITNR
jgi:hypothetical protein